MKTKLKMRRKTLVSALMVLFIISIIPASAQMTPTLDGVISPGEWGEVDFTIPSYEDHKVYVQNDLDYLYVAFVGEPGADYAVYGWTSICVYPGDDYAGKCWVYEPSGPGWSPDLTYYTTHHIQPPIVTDGELELSTNSVVEVGLNVMEWKIPLDEFSAKPGDTIAFDLYSYMDGFSSEETSWIYEAYYTLWPPSTVNLTATVLGHPVAIASATVDYLTVHFDGSSSYDLDGTIDIYSWDFGDGKSGTGSTPSHTYTAAGTYTANLTVTDDDGLMDSDVLTVKVTRRIVILGRPNIEPIANAGPNQKAWVGHTVYFNGSKSRDPDGYLIGYEWDFGDDTTASGVAVEHEYTKPGRYNVTLTVKDDRWAYDSDSCKIKISQPPTEVSAEFAERVRTREHIVDAMDEANTTVALNTTDDVTVTVLRYEEKPYPGDPIPASALPTYVDVEISDPDAVVWPIYVEMHYTDEEVMGLDESTFGIYYWSNGTWQRCSDTGVDTERNVVWAYMTVEEAAGSPILIAGMHAIPTPPLPPFFSNLIITPEKLELWDNVTISVDIMNPNDRAISYGFDMQIGEITFPVDVDLGAYESKMMSRTIFPTAVGIYNVTVMGMTGSFTVEVPEIPLRPAEFVVSDLIISPEEVELGDEVTISVLVTNIGEETGDYTITLDLPAGPFIRVQETVSLEGEESERVEFKVSQDIEGTHAVTVDGLTGSFTVKAPPEPEFQVSELTITPEEVELGDEVTVSFVITNIDSRSCVFVPFVQIGDMMIMEGVELEGHESRTVSHTITPENVGDYDVTIDGLEGSFTVSKKPIRPIWMQPGYVAGMLIIFASAGAVIYYAWKAKLFSPISSDST